LDPGSREPARPLATADVLRTWWPLAASWALMGAELPAISAAVARLDEPVVHLAAFGGVVFPLALLVEAPIIMMLAASTALCGDRPSFEKLYRFTTRSGALLTAIHALLAFTPLYDLVVVRLLGPPAEVVEPGRTGLMIMTPWTWMIADRRFHQGVLIRFGHSRAVGLGTALRLVSTGSALFAGYLARLPGIAVAAGALSFGVTVEMLFARVLVAPVLRERLPRRGAPSGAPVLTTSRLLSFYVPLALTPLLNLLAQPIGSASISRMPDAVRSLAAWPVLGGLIFLTRSLGIAFNEVVVRHADDPGARPVLARFALVMGGGTVALLVLLAATPLSTLWFERVAGVEPELARLADSALWLGVVLPGMTVAHSYYQGFLVHAHRTRAVTESVGTFLVVSSAILYAGVRAQRWNGLVVALLAFSAGSVTQALWLRLRERGPDAPPVRGRVDSEPA